MAGARIPKEHLYDVSRYRAVASEAEVRSRFPVLAPKIDQLFTRDGDSLVLKPVPSIQSALDETSPEVSRQLDSFLVEKREETMLGQMTKEEAVERFGSNVAISVSHSICFGCSIDFKSYKFMKDFDSVRKHLVQLFATLATPAREDQFIFHRLGVKTASDLAFRNALSYFTSLQGYGQQNELDLNGLGVTFLRHPRSDARVRFIAIAAPEPGGHLTEIDKYKFSISFLITHLTDPNIFDLALQSGLFPEMQTFADRTTRSIQIKPATIKEICGNEYFPPSLSDLSHIEIVGYPQ
ncbi:MAG: hypothetical protein WC527_08470 [Candidatus Margulisiibacteriota bacterium]